MAMHRMSSRTGDHDLYRNDDENVESAMGYLLKEEWSYIYEHSIVAQFGYILESDQIKKFFMYVQDPSFDKASDAAATFRELLTMHKSTVAEFLSKNYDWENNTLLESPNYITRRSAIKLLGAILLDRANSCVMVRYVCSLDNMRVLMNLLRDSNKSMQIEAFHVFKLFVANQKKPSEIVSVLIANRSKLIRFFSDFSLEKADEQFEADKAEVVKTGFLDSVALIKIMFGLFKVRQAIIVTVLEITRFKRKHK